MTTYQLIDSSTVNELHLKIKELEHRLEPVENKLATLDFRNSLDSKCDHRITLILISPPRPNEVGGVDEVIFCESLEAAREKETEILNRQHSHKRKILTATEKTYKPVPYKQ